jgi:hypothetical protein
MEAHPVQGAIAVDAPLVPRHARIMP